MLILTLNAWSSSLKYQIFNTDTKQTITKWNVEKIWLPGSFIIFAYGSKSKQIQKPIKTHEQAIKLIFEIITSTEYKIIDSIDDISAIWHRVVHGGEYFKESIIIDAKVISTIEKCVPLAPLHNPASLSIIYICRKLFSKIPQIAVFDTAFHQTMLPQHYIYPIPYEYYQKQKIRRYGFHGTSHKHIYDRLCELENKKDLKVISCHLWNWASITAIDGWKVIETSMWMTPLDGIVMWTRSGSIDPAIVLYLIKNNKMTVNQVQDVLNKKSGLLGISGKYSDMRDIRQKYKEWDTRCVLAMDIYINSILKYIWSYAVLLWWLDCIWFTGGVWQNADIVRKLVLEKLSRLGISLDEKRNKSDEKEKLITKQWSKIKAYVIPADEEQIIACETLKVISSKILKSNSSTKTKPTTKTKIKSKK